MDGVGADLSEPRQRAAMEGPTPTAEPPPRRLPGTDGARLLPRRVPAVDLEEGYVVAPSFAGLVGAREARETAGRVRGQPWAGCGGRKEGGKCRGPRNEAGNRKEKGGVRGDKVVGYTRGGRSVGRRAAGGWKAGKEEGGKWGEREGAEVG